MSGKEPKRKDRDPKRWADHEPENQAADTERKALAECYRILIEAGALKPPATKGEGGVPS